MSTITALDPTASEAQPAREGAKRTRKVLVKKVKPPVPVKKYVWLAGHGLTIVFGSIYITFYTFRWFLSSFYYTPRICYRLSFIGVLLSYSITLITTFGTALPDYQTLLATANFRNLLLAIPWLLSRPSAFKLLPYYFVTTLQLSSHFNVQIFLNHQYQVSDLVALSEIIVIFALLFDTFLFKGGSGIALTIYLGFFWLRLNFSPYTQVHILKIVKFIDDKVMSKQKPEIQAKWKKVKDFVEYRRSKTKNDEHFKPPKEAKPTSNSASQIQRSSRAPSVSKSKPGLGGMTGKISQQNIKPFSNGNRNGSVGRVDNVELVGSTK